MNVRRLPGFMYHYKVVTLFVFSSSLLVVYLLLHWGIMCTNLEAWRHVSNVVSPSESHTPADGPYRQPFPPNKHAHTEQRMGILSRRVQIQGSRARSTKT